MSTYPYSTTYSYYCLPNTPGLPNEYENIDRSISRIVKAGTLLFSIHDALLYGKLSKAKTTIQSAKRMLRKFGFDPDVHITDARIIGNVPIPFADAECIGKMLFILGSDEDQEFMRYAASLLGIEHKEENYTACHKCKYLYPKTNEWFATKPKREYELEIYCKSCYGSVHRRRDLLNALPHNFKKEDWEYCLWFFNQQCAVCGAWNTEDDPLQKDHWIPVTNPKCPGTIPSNIIPLCRGCNRVKNNQDPDIWIEGQIRRWGSDIRGIDMSGRYRDIREYIKTARRTPFDLLTE